MGIEGAWRLGIGVALSWAALPLLFALARRSRHAAPTAYHRALVAALAFATALVFAPLLRGWARAAALLPTPFAGAGDAGSRAITIVAELMSPVLGSTADAWPSTPLARLLSGLGHVWLLLLAAGVATSIAGHLRLWRQFGALADAPPGVLAHAARIARQLGVRVPAIRMADGVASAFSYGFFSPVVVLSSASCKSAAALDFVLRHELCHVARSDTRAAFAIDLAQRCFVGHPCLRSLAAEIRFARESAVDEAAAGNQPLEYARFLLSMAEALRAAPAPFPSLVSMADTALERRVEILIAPTAQGSRQRPRMPWLGISGLTLCSLVFLAPSSWGRPSAKNEHDATRDGNPGGGHVEPESAAPGMALPDPSGTVAATQAVSQRLPPDTIRSVVRQRYEQFRACYEPFAQRRLAGRVTLRFTIGRDGHVAEGAATSDDLPELGACVEPVMRSMRFPAPDGGVVTVVYPVMFEPGDAPPAP